MSDWIAIDTAPKDGTSILLYVPQKVLPQRNAPSSKWKMFQQRVIEARWIAPPPDDKSVTISPFGRELEAKFGGYWTADPRCIRRCAECLPIGCRCLRLPNSERNP